MAGRERRGHAMPGDGQDNGDVRDWPERVNETAGTWCGP